MSRPVWLTFSNSKILISSVAKGFKCFAAEAAAATEAAVLWTAAEKPKLEAAEAMGAAGDVESPRLRDTWWARSPWGRMIFLAEDIFVLIWLIQG
jgi:hypothetical protein